MVGVHMHIGECYLDTLSEKLPRCTTVSIACPHLYGDENEAIGVLCRLFLQETQELKSAVAPGERD